MSEKSDPNKSTQEMLERLKHLALRLDAEAIDTLYGLEPVYEAGSDPNACA